MQGALDRARISLPQEIGTGENHYYETYGSSSEQIIPVDSLPQGGVSGKPTGFDIFDNLPNAAAKSHGFAR